MKAVLFVKAFKRPHEILLAVYKLNPLTLKQKGYYAPLTGQLCVFVSPSWRRERNPFLTTFSFSTLRIQR
jgi:hypothetical protein